MYSYSRCPNCGNSEKGFSIHQCKECGHIGCFKPGGVFSSNQGRFSGTRCPRCDKNNSTKQLDRLE